MASQTAQPRTHMSAQDQLSTRAIELASAANTKADFVMETANKHFEILRDELRDMRLIRASQHQEAEDKFDSIQRAMWSAALALVLLLAGWVFYLATHQH